MWFTSSGRKRSSAWFNSLDEWGQLQIFTLTLTQPWTLFFFFFWLLMTSIDSFFFFENRPIRPRKKVPQAGTSGCMKFHVSWRSAGLHQPNNRNIPALLFRYVTDFSPPHVGCYPYGDSCYVSLIWWSISNLNLYINWHFILFCSLTYAARKIFIISQEIKQ